MSLSARGPKGPLSFSLRVDPEYAHRGNLIGTLCARTLIRDLEEGMSPLHDRRGSLQERVAKDRVKEEIVRLGVTYGLASRETSFVAVEKRETPVTGEMELKRVPIALTHGWGGLDRVVLRSRVSGGTLGAPQAAAGAFRGAKALRSLGSFKDAVFGASFDASEDMALGIAIPAAPPLRPLDRLVALERADGSWELTKELADILGKKLTELESELSGATGDPAETRRAWATALALVWLKTEASNEVGEWALLEKKARKWLSKCQARLPGSEWLDRAAAYLSKS